MKNINIFYENTDGTLYFIVKKKDKEGEVKETQTYGTPKPDAVIIPRHEYAIKAKAISKARWDKVKKAVVDKNKLRKDASKELVKLGLTKSQADITAGVT